MKITKFASALAGVSLLTASLLPMSASALSTATITMDGAYSSNGQFSVVVYEDTGADTVTGANVVLNFSQPVSNVSYDYSVGPFTAVTPSGAHNAYGTVTGRNALARVSFTMATPGTVIADVSESSYLKHAGEATVENFVLNLGEAYFTYTAPAPKEVAPKTTSTAASDTPAPAATASPTDTPAALDAAKDDQKDTKKEAAKEVKSSHVGLVTSSVTILVILAAAAAYWLLIHRRAEVAPVKAYKLGEPTAASKTKPAKKKPAAKKK